MDNIRKYLLITISVLLVAILISSKILIDEIEKTIPIIDYTIYDVREPIIHKEIPEEGILIEFIRAIEEESDTKEYKYKFYRKFTLVAFCTCRDCQRKWRWEPLPRFRRLRQGVTVAANPKSLALGTHIMILDNKYIVSFVDESIPENMIYVYVKYHENIDEDWCKGIHDVYKAKNK